MINHTSFAGSYLIVPTEILKYFYSHFGMIFRQAAQQIRARVKHDGFETSVIEVNADDLKQFLHVLQTIPSPGLS